MAEWLECRLRQVRGRIRELEVKELRERHARERARVEQPWKIQPRRAGSAALPHRGGCALCNAPLDFLDHGLKRAFSYALFKAPT
ncbi:hypothetical protein [Streptomyces pulveraceus]|uniref:Uncharacterized protein n=1 Tax=Streptomyces pulveraceus TaxID=68258 RepID=A0ABW1GMQ9_9ACTN